MNYKRGDRQITLPCKHVYHANCVTQWLSINKVSKDFTLSVNTTLCISRVYPIRYFPLVGMSSLLGGGFSLGA
ncbi:hypothetical protein BHE74_00018493 [Ensete ventricosum]|nr:hypothetical protein BHE74_00018493 [Ensete ventricosum]RZR83996.1 hypothetical protein BHM03_00010722 [Ensete ventricosum]